jgi:hypothetical protein
MRQAHYLANWQLPREVTNRQFAHGASRWVLYNQKLSHKASALSTWQSGNFLMRKACWVPYKVATSSWSKRLEYLTKWRHPHEVRVLSTLQSSNFLMSLLQSDNFIELKMPTSSAGMSFSTILPTSSWDKFVEYCVVIFPQQASSLSTYSMANLWRSVAPLS